MTLRLYNTLTRRKEDFVPLDTRNVRMYVCGPTVYDYAHIGNARPVIVFDVLFRLLRHLAAKGEWDGGKGETKVTYVRNITDVDDKINKRAAEEGISIRALTERTARQFHEDIAALGVLSPTFEPRATEHIDGMIRMIETLIDKGNAYAADGHVLFDVTSDPHYGCLSGRSQDEMIAGARVEVAPYKRNPMDFVLWKPSTDNLPGWDSPWGRGRPGWHIECSVMSDEFLGNGRHEPFDIHGGGHDLIFPHHENEIAQSTCALGNDLMARYWLHNGFLQVEGEKMSKSLGNFITIHELLKDWPGRAIRFNMLKTHYSRPINWTLDELQKSADELAEWATAIELMHGDTAAALQVASQQSPIVSSEIIDALCDDLNTHEAITFLRSLFTRANKEDCQAAEALMNNCEFLGLMRVDRLSEFDRSVEGVGSGIPEALTKHYNNILKLRAAIANNLVRERSEIISAIEADGISIEWAEDGSISLERAGGAPESEIERKIAARLAARAAKNWAEADRIRDELAAQGVTLKDSKDPATGEVVTTWEVTR